MDINGDNFKEKIKTGNSVVDFYAEWCGPCKKYGPIFHDFVENYEGNVEVNFGSVNVDDNQELAQEQGVMSIPTTLFVKDGEVVESVTGVMDKDQLKEKIESNF